MKLVVELLRARLRGMLYLLKGAPYQSAMLLHLDDGMRKLGLEKLRAAWEASKVFLSWKGGSVLTEMQKRSPMRWVFTRSLIKLAKAGGFNEVTPDLKKFLVATWHGVGQTVLSETGIQILRDTEEKRSHSKSVLQQRMMADLRREPLLDGPFKYKQLSPKPVARGRGVSRRGRRGRRASQTFSGRK